MDTEEIKRMATMPERWTKTELAVWLVQAIGMIERLQREVRRLGSTGAKWECSCGSHEFRPLNVHAAICATCHGPMSPAQ